MVYTVGEAAKRLGIAPSTLRYYDKEGLLPFVERSSGGIRMFQEKDFEWLQVIECMKKAGMPIRAIREYIEMALQGDDTIEARLGLFRRQQAAVARQLEELQHTMEMIRYKCWYYETALAAGTIEVPKNMDDSAVPEEFQAIRRSLRQVPDDAGENEIKRSL